MKTLFTLKNFFNFNLKIKKINLPQCMIAWGKAMIGKTPKISMIQRVAKKILSPELRSLLSNEVLSVFIVNTIYCPRCSVMKEMS